MLQGISFAALETFELFFFGDVQVELDDQRTVIDQEALEFVDLSVGALPFHTGGVAFYPLPQHPSLPRTVKYSDLAITRQLIPKTPKIVVPGFLLGWLYDRVYAISARVELFPHSLDCPPFAGTVRAFNHHYHTVLRLNQSTLQGQQLKLIFFDSLFVLLLVDRPVLVEFVQNHGLVRRFFQFGH